MVIAITCLTPNTVLRAETAQPHNAPPIDATPEASQRASHISLGSFASFNAINTATHSSLSVMLCTSDLLGRRTRRGKWRTGWRGWDRIWVCSFSGTSNVEEGPDRTTQFLRLGAGVGTLEKQIVPKPQITVCNTFTWWIHARSNQRDNHLSFLSPQLSSFPRVDCFMSITNNMEPMWKRHFLIARVRRWVRGCSSPDIGRTLLFADACVLLCQRPSCGSVKVEDTKNKTSKMK